MQKIVDSVRQFVDRGSEYRLTRDTLFKILFVKYPDLLKHLVASLLALDIDTIDEFTIENPENPPEQLGDKFCRLDIKMRVDGKLVNLEGQVEDEHDYPPRSMPSSSNYKPNSRPN